MLLRSATPDDIPALMDLERDAATAAHWARDHYDKLFGGFEPKRVMLVIEEDARPLGFLVARPIGVEWEIENVVVVGQARRRGLGSSLVKEVLAQARSAGAEAVFLEVRSSNHIARAFYEKWAFLESGKRAGYYRDPEEDAVVYRLSFP